MSISNSSLVSLMQVLKLSSSIVLNPFAELHLPEFFSYVLIFFELIIHLFTPITYFPSPTGFPLFAISSNNLLIILLNP